MKPEPAERGVGRRFLLLLAGIQAAALAVRLAGLGGSDLWLDEILHLRLLREAAGQSWWKWLLPLEPEHGPLFHLASLPGRLFSSEPEVWLRLPHAVAGSASVFLAGLLGRALFDETAGLLAAILVAGSPLHVEMSRQARPSALAATFVLALLAAAVAGRPGSSSSASPFRGRLPVLVAVALAAAGTTASVLPALGAIGAAAVVTAIASRERRRNLSLALAAGVGLGLGAALYGGRAAPRVALGFGDTTEGLVRKTAEALFGSGAAVPLGLLASIGIVSSLLRPEGLRNRRLVAISAVAIPLATLLALRAVDHWFAERYLLPAVAPLLVIAAGGAATLVGWTGRGAVPLRTAALVGAAIGAFALGRQGLERSRHRVPWRGLAVKLAAWSGGGPVVVANDWTETSLRYGAERTGSRLRFENVRDDPAAAKAALGNRGKGFFVIAGHPATGPLRSFAESLPLVVREVPERTEIRFFPDVGALPEAVRSDLVRAGGVTARARIDVGGDEAPAVFGSGWSAKERTPAGRTFRWSDGPEARILLPIPAGSGALVLTVRPFTAPGIPAQRLTARLDGAPLADLPVPEGWSELVLAFPAVGHLRFAELALGFPGAVQPSAAIAGSGDARRLAVAVDTVLFRSVGTEPRSPGERDGP